MAKAGSPLNGLSITVAPGGFSGPIQWTVSELSEVLAAWDAARKIRAFRPRSEESVEGTESPPVEGLPPVGGDSVAPAA